jgi:hypothetical protein
MNRLSAVVWMLLIVAAAFLLYMVKYQVQYLRTQVAQTTRDLEVEREGLNVVAAEWAYLNRPDRLQQLASKYLVSSEELTVDQVADIQEIPFPRQLQAAASQDDGVQPAAAQVSRAAGDRR